MNREAWYGWLSQTTAAVWHQVVRTVTNPTYSNVGGTLDDEAVSEAVKADGATLLVQVHLLFRQEVSNPAACTQSVTERQQCLTHTVTFTHRFMICYVFAIILPLEDILDYNNLHSISC